MKFAADDKIPYIRGVFEAFGEVVYLPGNRITSADIRDVEVLITRTRTRCNRQLLEGSAVKFIATATIGYDHIDTDYCERAGIGWANAPGCNSRSVEQYIASALFVIARGRRFTLTGKTIGVVGVGQVGFKVAALAQKLGMRVLLNDPPRARAEGKAAFVSLQTIMEEADIITLHVPLTTAGEDKTLHLADAAFFGNLRKKPVVINSCRGKVMDNQAAKTAIKEGLIAGLVLDCWEHEPDIDLQLLDLCLLATPHIAGYSRDGKANGTAMSVRAISRFFNLGIDNWEVQNIEPPPQNVIPINGKGLSDEQIISRAVLYTYDIRNDDRTLRKNPELFEKLRSDYPLRREFPAYLVERKSLSDRALTALESIGFKVLRRDGQI